MDEVASVTPLQGSGSVKVRLVDINVTEVKFISSQSLENSASEQLSLRFTLPGKPRLHFALIELLPAMVRQEDGFCYEAKFVRTDPLTVDHIIQCLAPIPVAVGKESGTLHLH